MGSINDVDSFDTDRLSGSIQYDDDQQDLPYNHQPNTSYETIQRNVKKTKQQVFDLI